MLVGEEFEFFLCGFFGSIHAAKAKLNELLVEERCDIASDILQDGRVKNAAQSEFLRLIIEVCCVPLWSVLCMCVDLLISLISLLQANDSD